MPSTASKPASIDAQRDALRQNLQRQLLQQIPLAAAMQLDIAAWNGERLTLRAPLAPNVNDKGCAFGGSLVSVMTLACWSLVKLAADQHDLACEIYVQDSTVRYLAPVWDDFSAIAELADEPSLAGFLDTLATRGKARIAIRCMVPLADGSPACTLDARFVAIRGKLPADAANAAQSASAPSHKETP